MRRPAARALLGLLMALALCGPAGAQDAAALMLVDADAGAAAPAPPGDWRLFGEGAGGAGSERLSAELGYDHGFGAGWRAVLAARLDRRWPSAGAAATVSTVKDAYLSWQAQDATLFDAGRINLRNGVAAGYNPTDYFRAGALRSRISIDPASLRENRQGSLMLRGQRLWTGGSLTAVYAPARDGAAPDSIAGAGVEARALLVLSQQVGELTPQLLLYKAGPASPQTGLNLTGLLNDATVAHLEWSAGRGPGQLEQARCAGQGCAAGAWRQRLSAGLVWTSADKLSLTAEYHYNGAAPGPAGWRALRDGALPDYARYRDAVQAAQDLPTRRALFFYASRRDALMARLDLNAMVNLDLVDASRLLWLEARYHAGRHEFALQWQGSGGAALSNFGAMRPARSWQFLLRHYFF